MTSLIQGDIRTAFFQAFCLTFYLFEYILSKCSLLYTGVPLFLSLLSLSLFHEIYIFFKPHCKSHTLRCYLFLSVSLGPDLILPGLPRLFCLWSSVTHHQFSL